MASSSEMGGPGLSEPGLRRLRDTMSAQLQATGVPGLVLGLSRGRDVYLEALGSAIPGGAPIQPDALFRITSMTRPVTAVATLLLVQQGLLALDEPVDRLLPELAARRVLRRPEGPVDDTVPARRPITVGDLLSFRAGFGMILAPPSDYPILEAEQALELRSVGPPVPITPHGPDEWMRRMGRLPLMDQPGTRWRYNTGSQILGVLIARASGQTAGSFYQQRIFQPLGMAGTGFLVPEAERHRLVPIYEWVDGRLEPFDDGGAWTHARAFTDCGAGLVSTVGDYLTFARMLLSGGSHQGRLFLDPQLLSAMTTDQLTAEQRQTAGPILDGRGWGFGVSIIDEKAAGAGSKGYGWRGGFGTLWVNDPDRNLAAVLCAQVLGSRSERPGAPGESELEAPFWAAVDGALRD